jgi:hypothetical protein
MNPRIRIRIWIHTKMSWIRNTGLKLFESSSYIKLPHFFYISKTTTHEYMYAIIKWDYSLYCYYISFGLLVFCTTNVSFRHPGEFDRFLYVGDVVFTSSPEDGAKEWILILANEKM